ncbi:ABC transporter substrate-binding protein [Bosea lathyri]|uniref:Carbohydrate ABC transporter substrate-binding protein, CUT1 family n=1 Tax=Bosea lathyri TaxID=1036778 RepID=A0A1H6C9S4_9HYPH|nr:extracellular solute-binding protein [Bosea lathyri]SEG69375.1 carbohydrate ABC transporter substrate-binding protein, CUT1 family [Bosea lathyri]
MNDDTKGKSPYLSRRAFGRTALLTGAAIAAPAILGRAAFAQSADALKDYTSANIDWKREAGAEIMVGGATHPWSNAVTPFIPQFTALTGIKVTTDFRSETEFLTALPIKLASGSTTPDVFMYLAYGQGITAGWLEPLNAYYGNKDLVDLAWYDEQDVLKPAREYPLWRDGERYAFPITAEAQTLYVNKAMLDQKGLATPKTFDEMLKVARALKTSTTAGIAMRAKAAGNATFPLTGFLYSYGGELMKDGRVVYDSPEAVAGIEMFTTMLREAGPIGVSNYDWYEALGDFMQGAAAMTSDTSNFATDISNPTKSKVSAQAQFAGMPTAGDKPSRPNMSCWQAAVNAKSRNKNAAFLFMIWATSKATSLQTSARGLATTRASAWESDGFKKAFGPQAAEAAVLNLKNADADLAKRVRFHPQSPQILNELAVGVSLALSGSESAASAMKKAAAKANAALRT